MSWFKFIFDNMGQTGDQRPTPEEALDKLRDALDILQIGQNYVLTEHKSHYDNYKRYKSTDQKLASEAKVNKKKYTKQLFAIDHSFFTVLNQVRLLESAIKTTRMSMNGMALAGHSYGQNHNYRNTDNLYDLISEDIARQQRKHTEARSSCSKPSQPDPEINEDELLAALNMLEDEDVNEDTEMVDPVQLTGFPDSPENASSYEKGIPAQANPNEGMQCNIQ